MLLLLLAHVRLMLNRESDPGLLAPEWVDESVRVAARRRPLLLVVGQWRRLAYLLVVSGRGDVGRIRGILLLVVRASTLQLANVSLDVMEVSLLQLLLLLLLLMLLLQSQGSGVAVLVLVDCGAGGVWSVGRLADKRAHDATIGAKQNSVLLLLLVLLLLSLVGLFERVVLSIVVAEPRRTSQAGKPARRTTRQPPRQLSQLAETLQGARWESMPMVVVLVVVVEQVVRVVVVGGRHH